MKSLSKQRSVVEEAEQRYRTGSGIVWDCHRTHGANKPGNVTPKSAPIIDDFALSDSKPERLAGYRGDSRPVAKGYPIPPTTGAAYLCDGTFEGILCAIYAAMQARDSSADIVDARQFQPRIGQQAIDVETNLENALKVRRCIEYAQGPQAFTFIQAAVACDDACKGTVIYRFVLYALRQSTRKKCNTCPQKAHCLSACEAPNHCDLLENVSAPEVFDLVKLYRQAMNERHLLEQFIRFQHCEGDVWFARCNPKASVVPLLMDWFVPRFNDQRFVIYDENHALSGIYDGTNWYLVSGESITPPPESADEIQMQEAWRCFYRSVSIESRYHPELRRNFMPMRLWRNLPELQATLAQAPLRDSIPE